jgi:putative OPT family oligopeptide transporter
VTRELTLRGVLLGIAITVVFTAANVYLGLKVGLTFSTAIPAAVISMALLQRFGGVTIQENNIVQTLASSAGAMASVIFVLPGLVMVGWWASFPFWTTFVLCASGGVLGVMYSVPLRRALVVQSNLPYPEGRAAAEVLKVGTGTREGAREERAGLLVVVVGSLAAAGYSAMTAAKVVAGEVAGYFRVGPAATGLSGSLSFALLGAGHLMGLAVGVAMLVGVAIAWGVATPALTAMQHAAGPAADAATGVWSRQVRFLGAGAIGVAAVWTLARLIGPILLGLRNAMAANRRLRAGEDLPRTERDVPVLVMLLVSLACLAPLAVILHQFLVGTPLAAQAPALVAIAILYVILAGFVVAAVCGYMAGLIGTSNSPVSGVAILAVLGAALVLAGLAAAFGWTAAGPVLVAFALFVTSIILAVAVTANDNLQDLKTGQLVDATPWRQQVALVIGTIAGSLAIAPVLDLLNRAYGFAGAPNVDAIASEPLPAPQATLISTLAKGVIQGDLDWGLLGVGALIGVVLVALDEGLRRSSRRYSLPPLAVGIAIYLPPSVSVPAIIGAFVGAAYDRWTATGSRPEAAKRMGVLLASGLIVGESLFSVVLAGIIVASGKGEPLALVRNFEGPATILGFLIFAATATTLYRWSRGLAERKGEAAAMGEPSSAQAR